MGLSSTKKKAKNAILGILKSEKSSKKEIIKKVLDQFPTLEKKEVKKALRKLQENNQICAEDNSYIINQNESSRKAIQTSSSFPPREGKYPYGVASSESGSDIEIEQPLDTRAIPFAEMLRQKAAASVSAEDVSTNDGYKRDRVFDIDDEIRCLEAALAGGSDSDDDVSEGSTDEEQEGLSRTRKVSFGATSVKAFETTYSKQEHNAPGAIICLSEVADERIAPLPESYLPQTRKRTLKGIDRDHLEQPRKKARDLVSDGLKDAVREVLEGYVARSSERLPFYCRLCAKQYENEEEFFAHKTSHFHKAAVDMEQKVSFCKLCRKQFTSPVQLKEHLSSRPHKLQLDRARQGQRGGRGGRGGGRGGDLRGQSQRQWC